MISSNFSNLPWFRVSLLFCLLFFQSVYAMPLDGPSSSDESIIRLKDLNLNDLSDSGQQQLSSQELVVLPDEKKNLFQDILSVNNNNKNEIIDHSSSRRSSSGKNLMSSSDEDTSDAYFKYIVQASSLNKPHHMNQKKKALNKLNSNNQLNMNRKIFRADKNLQRLEKKSWKIPIKTVALYKDNYQSPQKMVGELNELFDSFKNS